MKNEFQNIADERGFERIPDFEDEKYATIKEYPVDVYNKDYLSENWEEAYKEIEMEEEEIDLNLVYALWQNPIYVKLLYISFISQLLYTDISNVKKITFVSDEKLADLIEDLFGYWIHESENLQIEHITVNSQELIYSEVANNTQIPRLMNKYLISLFDDVRETEYILISDCESFPFGVKTPVYKNIYQSYKNENDFPVLGCHVEDSNVFLNRRKHLAGMMYNDQEYIDWCCRRLQVNRQEFVNNIVNMGHWYLTCWFGYGEDKYNSDSWEEYVYWSRAYSMYCDESIYLTYGICKEDYKVEDISYIDDLQFVHAFNCEKFFREKGNNEFGILHPLHGKYVKDFWVQDFYDFIQNEFQKLIEE